MHCISFLSLSSRKSSLYILSTIGVGSNSSFKYRKFDKMVFLSAACSPHNRVADQTEFKKKNKKTFISERLNFNLVFKNELRIRFIKQEK